MLVATETPDPPRGATLFAEIPLPMTELELQRTFGQPLGEWLTEQAVEFSLRCFRLPARQDRPPGIGIEIQTDKFGTLAFAVEKIAELGAPPETRIEIESEKATIEMTLAEAAGI
jgi:hypothetical protein